MSSDSALRIADLSKCYQIYARPQDRLLQSLWRGRRRYYREFWALRDVSFEVARGEAVAIIGRNGSGKSTLLQLVAGTLSPTAGSVEATGRVAALLELGSGFNPEFTGRENVFMNGAILGFGPREVEQLFPEIEAFAEIGEFIDQPVKTYSSGMLMRLAFAVSVNVEPEILIVDEALSVGDVVFQFRCLERLRRLIQSGTTLLFVSHDLGMVKAFCTRAVYLDGGRLRAIGAAEDMAELYLSDTRQERRRSLAVAAEQTEVAAPGDARARIVSAHFVDTGGLRASYRYGEEFEIEVKAEMDATLMSPAVTALIQDRRMIAIAGKAFRVNGAGGQNQRRSVTVRFAARAMFDAGSYFVTLRIEERASQASFVTIDKQVGLLSFDVLRDLRQDFLGMVDIAMTSRELQQSG